jgi:hypothetical protein
MKPWTTSEIKILDQKHLPSAKWFSIEVIKSEIELKWKSNLRTQRLRLAQNGIELEQAFMHHY